MIGYVWGWRLPLSLPYPIEICSRKKSGIFLSPILIHFYKVCILFKTTVKMQFRVIPRYFYCSATPSIVNIYSNKI